MELTRRFILYIISVFQICFHAFKLFYCVCVFPNFRTPNFHFSNCTTFLPSSIKFFCSECSEFPNTQISLLPNFFIERKSSLIDISKFPNSAFPNFRTHENSNFQIYEFAYFRVSKFFKNVFSEFRNFQICEFLNLQIFKSLFPHFQISNYEH